MENDNFNPSISKYCCNTADFRLSRTKNSCGALSTSTDIIIFFSQKKKFRSYVCICLCCYLNWAKHLATAFKPDIHIILLTLIDFTFCAVLIPSDHLKQLLPLKCITPSSDSNSLLFSRSFRLSSKFLNDFLKFQSSITSRVSFAHQLLNLHYVITYHYANFL